MECFLTKAGYQRIIVLALSIKGHAPWCLLKPSTQNVSYSHRMEEKNGAGGARPTRRTRKNPVRESAFSQL